MAITGVHSLLYSSEPEALRTLLVDVLGLGHVDDGQDAGWLIFKLPPAEMGVHPGDAPAHEVSLMCDDLASTISDLESKGVVFDGPPVDQGFGVVVKMLLPGGVEMLLYEPRHHTAIATSRIQQRETFNASAAEIYELLTDSTKFSEMTGGAPADIDSSEGGAISMFGGMIAGRTIEAVPNQRLVQAWRVQSWDPGAYSIVKFEINQEGTTTTVSLDQAGFPEDQAVHLEPGWHDNYWNNIRTATGG